MKTIKLWLSKDTSYLSKLEFAVYTKRLRSGEEIFTPVVRKRGWLNSGYWTRIVMIYNRYELIDIAFEPKLSYEECVAHIHGYIQQLKLEHQQDLVQQEYKKITPTNVN